MKLLKTDYISIPAFTFDVENQVALRCVGLFWHHLYLPAVEQQLICTYYLTAVVQTNGALP